MKTAVSGCASELSYSCYDLSSLKSFSRSSFSFLVFPHSLSPSGLWEVFIFLMSRWFFSFFFFVTSFVLDGRQYLSYCQVNVCIQWARVSVFVDCGGAKWCKVFTPWFWLALVAEVDAGVRVVWHNGPGWHVVLPAWSICSTVGGLHLTWLL